MLFPDEGPVPCMPYVLRWLEADMKRENRDFDRDRRLPSVSPSQGLGFLTRFE